jgi:aldehyde dehydrogenase (NAD+)/retinal dehydrogenase
MSTEGLDPKGYTKLYLNGQYVTAQSKETYSLKNPKNNAIVTDNVPIAGASDIDLAVKYAEEAFRGPWSTFTAVQRTECLLKLVSLLDEELTQILILDSLTSGIPVSLAPVRERNYIRNCVMYYAGWTDKQKGDYYPADDGE